MPTWQPSAAPGPASGTRSELVGILECHHDDGMERWSDMHLTEKNMYIHSIQTVYTYDVSLNNM